MWKNETVIVYRKHAITVGLKVYVTVQVLIQDIPNNLCRFWMGGYLSVVVIEVFFFFWTEIWKGSRSVEI